MATYDATSTAVDIWARMHRYRELGDHEWTRLRILRPGLRSISLLDPMFHAVRYPEVVTISSVLVSQSWQSMAMSTDTRQNAYDEIGRRLGFGDNYNWEPHRKHPLTYWAEGAAIRQRWLQQRMAAHSAAGIRTTEIEEWW